MPHYIILSNFTDQGIRNVKDTIKRAEFFKAAVEQAGGKFVSEYYTLGKIDIVTIVEAPNDETIMPVIFSYWKFRQCTHGNTKSIFNG